MPTVALFDFHETLVQLSPSTDALMAQIVGVPEQRCRAVFSNVGEAIDELRASGEWPPPGAERWARLYDLILRALDLPGTGAEVARRMSEHFTDPASYVAFREVPAMLRALEARGTPIGILSNTDVRLWPLLTHLGLDQYVDVAISTYLHGVEKPDREAFELVLDELGASPDEAWFIGDSVHHDVLPAAQLGMTPVLVDRLGVHQDGAGYQRLTSLDRLPDMLG